MLRTFVLALSVLAAAGATATTSSSSSSADGNACVFFRTVHDYRALDKNKLVVWAPGRRSAYLVEVGMPLLDLTWANQLAFVDSNHDGRLCGYGMDRIVIGDTSFPQWSTITSMRPLDEAALAQLEEQYKISLLPKKKRGSQSQH